MGEPRSSSPTRFRHVAFLLLRKFLLYIHPEPPRSVYCVFDAFLFRAVSVQMSSQGSCSEDYALRRQRELLQDLDQGSFVGWADDEKVKARRRDMDDSVMEEVKKMQSAKKDRARTGTSKPTFVGSSNAQRAFSHNMQGAIPHIPDLGSFPDATEALRVTDQFCEQYRVLRREVYILQEENNRLRKMLERFLTPLRVVPPSPKE